MSNKCLALVVTYALNFRRPQRDCLGTFSCMIFQRSGPLGCFPFLEETSERDDVQWTASASADDANGLNCVSLAGLCVKKKRDEDASPLHLLYREWMVQVINTFLQCNDTLWNAFEGRNRFSAKLAIFRVFWCVPLLEHSCSVSLKQPC